MVVERIAYVFLLVLHCSAAEPGACNTIQGHGQPGKSLMQAFTRAKLMQEPAPLEKSMKGTESSMPSRSVFSKPTAGTPEEFADTEANDDAGSTLVGLDEDGFQTVKSENDEAFMQSFVRKVVKDSNWTICDESALHRLVHSFAEVDTPNTYQGLLAELYLAANGNCPWIGTEQNEQCAAFGATAALDDAGYKTVQKASCFPVMRLWIKRAAGTNGYRFCSEGALSGLTMSYYKKDSEGNYTRLQQELASEAAKDSPWVVQEAAACPGEESASTEDAPPSTDETQTVNDASGTLVAEDASDTAAEVGADAEVEVDTEAEAKAEAEAEAETQAEAEAEAEAEADAEAEAEAKTEAEEEHQPWDDKPSTPGAMDTSVISKKVPANEPHRKNGKNDGTNAISKKIPAGEPQAKHDVSYTYTTVDEDTSNNDTPLPVDELEASNAAPEATVAAGTTAVSKKLPTHEPQPFNDVPVKPVAADTSASGTPLSPLEFKSLDNVPVTQVAADTETENADIDPSDNSLGAIGDDSMMALPRADDASAENMEGSSASTSGSSDDSASGSSAFSDTANSGATSKQSAAEMFTVLSKQNDKDQMAAFIRREVMDKNDYEICQEGGLQGLLHFYLGDQYQTATFQRLQQEIATATEDKKCPWVVKRGQRECPVASSCWQVGIDTNGADPTPAGSADKSNAKEDIQTGANSAPLASSYNSSPVTSKSTDKLQRVSAPLVPVWADATDSANGGIDSSSAQPEQEAAGSNPTSGSSGDSASGSSDATEILSNVAPKEQNAAETFLALSKQSDRGRMAAFIRREVIDKNDYELCQEGGLQGLLHFYLGDKYQTATFQRLQEEIATATEAKKCPWVVKKGQRQCPRASACWVASIDTVNADSTPRRNAKEDTKSANSAPAGYSIDTVNGDSTLVDSASRRNAKEDTKSADSAPASSAEKRNTKEDVQSRSNVIGNADAPVTTKSTNDMPPVVPDWAGTNSVAEVPDLADADSAAEVPDWANADSAVEAASSQATVPQDAAKIFTVLSKQNDKHKMAAFIRREVMDKNDYELCQEGGLQGLLPFYLGDEHQTATFQRLQEEIAAVTEDKSCPWVVKRGQRECPEASACWADSIDTISAEADEDTHSDSSGSNTVTMSKEKLRSLSGEGLGSGSGEKKKLGNQIKGKSGAAEKFMLLRKQNDKNKMAAFIRREVMDKNGYELCAEGGLQGLIPFYLGNKYPSNTFKRLQEEIAEKTAEKNCPWVVKKGQRDCPEASACWETKSDKNSRSFTAKRHASRKKKSMKAGTRRGSKIKKTNIKAGKRSSSKMMKTNIKAGKRSGDTISTRTNVSVVINSTGKVSTSSNASKRVNASVATNSTKKVNASSNASTRVNASVTINSTKKVNTSSNVSKRANVSVATNSITKVNTSSNVSKRANTSVAINSTKKVNASSNASTRTNASVTINSTKKVNASSNVSKRANSSVAINSTKKLNASSIMSKRANASMATSSTKKVNATSESSAHSVHNASSNASANRSSHASANSSSSSGANFIIKSNEMPEEEGTVRVLHRNKDKAKMAKSHKTPLERAMLSKRI